MCIRDSCSIAVAANRAGIGGITVLGAGGLGDSSGIAVTGCRNRLGVGVAAVGAGVSDAAVLGAGRRSFTGLLIAVLMVGFHSHHILGAIHHIGGGAGCHAGKGKLSVGLGAVSNSAGSGSPGKGGAVIARCV